ncbi:DUF1697 domain-containing protein [Novosphingobium sp. PC22D]|uniref:DUF1697 domain-containing protein n=1 Tax=Novosphingobium sp. PC22D TaxID=1962403 RepID=UPI0026B370BB
MTRYVAFLGSINVGGNRLAMADLVAAMEAEGFAHVATVVASGNLLFDHAGATEDKLEAQIARIIADRFGIETFATVRTAAEVRAAIEDNPFRGEGEDKLVHTYFLECQPSAVRFEALIADQAGRGRERLAAGARVLHVD